MAANIPDLTPFTLDLGTVLSLALVFALLPLSQFMASIYLPKTISRTYYYLFLWCSFDVLTHTIVEGSYLYHCFFSYINIPSISPTADYPHPASLGRSMGRTGIESGAFLGRTDRLYGSWYSDNPMARLWQEYAKADRRWGGADPTVIALELLTVFGAGPLALYICTLIARIHSSVSLTATSAERQKKAQLKTKLWFVAVVLSTAELYGGFITFAPEWLTGSTMLTTDDPVYMWLYLVFFNMLWVFIPFWVLWAAWKEMGSAFYKAELAGVQGKKVQ